MAELISVIIPAYNAGKTLATTLDSVLRQSHKEFEAIVVDDGSQDNTGEVAHRFVRLDSRFKILEQSNRGVAAARNAGIASAGGSFIAPLDADDIWHTDKLRRQVEVFAASRANVALVYNWFRRIDGKELITEPSASPVVEGYVLHRHLDWNFIGNGSTPLFRRIVFDRFEYDTRLRESGNEGCEDYLLQLQIASQFEFACARGFYTGYRKRGGEMSSDVGRMLRSYLQMYRIIRETVGPEARRIVDERVAALSIELARNRLRRGYIVDGTKALSVAFRKAPLVGARHGAMQLKMAAEHMLGSLTGEARDGTRVGPYFNDLSPDEAYGGWHTSRRGRRICRLHELDERMSPPE